MTSYGQFLCVAAAVRLLSICDFDRRCTEYEAYLSTQPPSPQQGSRFPYENGYFQWPQGACPPSCKGPQGSVRLMKYLGNQQKHEHRSKQNGSDSRAIICFALLPFLWLRFLRKIAVCRRIFYPAASQYSLEIHKVFHRSYCLLRFKIPRRHPSNFSLRTSAGIVF